MMLFYLGDKLDILRNALMILGLGSIAIHLLIGIARMYHVDTDEILTKTWKIGFLVSISLVAVGFFLPTSSQVHNMILESYIDEPDPVQRLKKINEFKKVFNEIQMNIR